MEFILYRSSPAIGTDKEDTHTYDYASMVVFNSKKDGITNESYNSNIIDNPYYGDDVDVSFAVNNSSHNIKGNDLAFEAITATKNIYYEWLSHQVIF